MIKTIVTIVLVPLLAIFASEAWAMGAHFRCKTSPADPRRTMRAVRYHEHGEARKVLKVEKVARPQHPPAPGTVLIKVAAAALNPVDFKMRRNDQPSLLIPKPFIPGYDVAGIVTSVGKGVTRFSPGDRVYGMLPILGGRWGSLAEFVAADASILAKAPTSIPLAHAAALPLVALTVQQVVDQARHAANVAAEDDQHVEHLHGPPTFTRRRKFLVHAASGGVGSLAVQYARHVLKFDEVLATCSEANAEFVRSLGASTTIDYKTTPFEDVAKGVDVAIDPMAWSYMERALANASGGGGVMRPGGAYCHILSSDWASNAREANPLIAFEGAALKWASAARAFLQPSTVRVHSSAVAPDGAGLERIARYVDAGLLKPVVDREYEGLDQAVDAFEYLEAGHAKGKVIVRL